MLVTIIYYDAAIVSCDGPIVVASYNSSVAIYYHYCSIIQARGQFLDRMLGPGPNPINENPALITLDFATLKFGPIREA